MKTFTILGILFMSALFYSPIAVAQMIFNDNMESYTTATATSINDLPNNSTSDPVFWARNSFQGEGSVNATAGITGITGARAAILEADFTGATDFWGAQLYSAANAGAGTALSFADLTYSFTIASSSGFGFYLNFNSFNSSFEATGTYRKAFTPTAAASFETISGNLAEGGWAANPFGLSANGLELNAANYSWSVEINGELGWTGSGNSLLIDQATFAVVPEPNVFGLVVLGSMILGLVRRRFQVRRRVSARLPVALLLFISSPLLLVAEETVLSDFSNKTIPFVYGSWIDASTGKIRLQQGPAGLETMDGATAKGGACDRAGLKFAPNHVIKLTFSVLKGNAAGGITVLLEDVSGAQAGWSFSMEGMGPGESRALTSRELSTPDFTSPNGKLLDLDNIVAWHVQGDHSSDKPLRVRFEKLVVESPD
jgi:hypothetical protein